MALLPPSGYGLIAPNGRPARSVLAAATVPSVTQSRSSILTRRIETRLGRGLESVIAAMPEIDEITAHEGSDIWARMRSDDAVFSAEFQLMIRIFSRPWSVVPHAHLAGEPFAKEVAEYVEHVFNGFATEAMLNHLYSGLRTKYAGGQLIYRKEDATLVPSEFIAERRSIFRFDTLGRCLINIDGLPREVDPFKWVVHVNEPEPERPAGRSIFSRVYWPWKFKRLGWEQWSTVMDRFAVPGLAALFEMADEGATVEDVQKMADALSEILLGISSGSVGALGNVKTLQQIGGLKSVEGFDRFLEACNQSIYRGILTTTLTVSEGKTGSERGNTAVHDETADRVAQYYAKQIAESVTMQPVAYAALLKYGEAARAVLPRFEYDFEDVLSYENVLKAIELAVPISQNALYSRYRVPEPSSDDDVFVSTAVATTGQGDADGATASLRRKGKMLNLEFPAEDEDLVRSKLYTYMRNREIKERFNRARADDASVDEALDVLEEKYPLSRSRLRDIAYS